MPRAIKELHNLKNQSSQKEYNHQVKCHELPPMSWLKIDN
jgi:hypothetical protein